MGCGIFSMCIIALFKSASIQKFTETGIGWKYCCRFIAMEIVVQRKSTPTDPYQEDAWPQGWGQLTQV